MSGRQQRRWIVAVYLLLVAAILLVSKLTTPAYGLAGDELIFISATDSIDSSRGSNSVYRIRLDGGGMIRIVGSIPHGQGYLLTSDIDCQLSSKSLVIASYKHDLNGFHHALLDGSNLHLDKPAAGNLLTALRQIALEPDGVGVILSREYGAYAQPRFGLVVGDLGSREYHSIMTPTAQRSYVSPDWSPDGTQIAYIIETRAGDSRATYALAIADPDGGNERIIYETTHIVGDIAWSPDGVRLAASINLQIFTMRADGSGVARLTDHVGGATTPRWSPDGGRIAYVTPSSFPGFQQIFVMEADGSGKRRVANIHGDVVMSCWV